MTNEELLRTYIAQLEAQLESAKQAIDRDKTGLSRALLKVQRTVSARMWLLEGRGPYEWDDDRYKDEAGVAMREVVETAMKALIDSGTLATETVQSVQKTLLANIPPMIAHEENVADTPTVQIATYNVFSWRQGSADSGEPCTEVHLVLPIGDETRVSLRLKSARALDELIGALLQHRKDVWP